MFSVYINQHSVQYWLTSIEICTAIRLSLGCTNKRDHVEYCYDTVRYEFSLRQVQAKIALVDSLTITTLQLQLLRGIFSIYYSRHILLP